MFEFKDFDFFSDGEIDLVLVEKSPENKERGYVPAYIYKITIHNCSEEIGKIDIRIGENEGLYYGGHIGYSVEEPYRGNNYAAKACQLIKQVAIGHGMNKLSITCNPDNYPSRRTCEKIGAKLVRIVDLPPHNEMYQLGERQKCIYHWDLINIDS